MMQQWLVDTLGEGPARIASVVLAVLVVLALALVVIALLRRMLQNRGGRDGPRGPRVEVLDVTPVDQKRRLVLIRRDRVEHLVLIGGPSDLLIEANIGAVQPQARRPEPAAVPEPARAAAPQPPQPPRRPQPHPQDVDFAGEAPPVSAPRPAPPPAARRADELSRSDQMRSAQAPVVGAPFDGPLTRTQATEPRTAPVIEMEARPAQQAPVPAAPRPRLDPVIEHERAQAPRPTQPTSRPTESAPLPVPPVRAPAQNPLPRATPTLQAGPSGPVSPVPSAPPSMAVAGPSAPIPMQQSTGIAAVPATGEAVPVDLTPGSSFSTPDEAATRQPLTVRSFASAIGERPSRAPTSAPSSAGMPVPSVRPPSRDESEVADRLDEGPRPGRPADEPSVPQADDPASAPDASRDLSLEEEMERLLRDFSQHTDRH